MRDHPHREEDPANLLAEVASGLGRLARGELALARAKVKQALHNAGAGLVKAVLAGVLGIVGLNILSGAAVAGLAEAGLGAGPAGLIVALVLLTGALFVGLSARAALRLKGLIPDRALHGLQQDAQAVQAGLTRKEGSHV